MTMSEGVRASALQLSYGHGVTVEQGETVWSAVIYPMTCIISAPYSREEDHVREDMLAHLLAQWLVDLSHYDAPTLVEAWARVRRKHNSTTRYPAIGQVLEAANIVSAERQQAAQASAHGGIAGDQRLINRLRMLSADERAELLKLAIDRGFQSRGKADAAPDFVGKWAHLVADRLTPSPPKRVFNKPAVHPPVRHWSEPVGGADHDE